MVVSVDEIVQADGLVGHVRVALMELIVKEALVVSVWDLVKLDISVPNVHSLHLIKR